MLPEGGRPRAGSLLVSLLLMAAWAALDVVATGPAEAALTIAKVQTGAEAVTSGTSISPALGASTGAGNLVVAVLRAYTGSSCPTFSAPSGWAQASSACLAGTGEVEIWYYQNNPGGMTRATFTASISSSLLGGELSEWSGVDKGSALDKSGGGTKSTSSTTFIVSTSAPTTANGEVAIAQFASSTSLSSYTAAFGWTHLYSDAAYAEVADYATGRSAGTVSETETASSSTTWAGVIATFRPACSGGSLNLTPPSTVTFPSISLNGNDRTGTVNATLAPDDETGSSSGWNLTGTSTTFVNGGGKTLPTTASTVTAASVAAATGNCSLPTNSVGYPVTLPAGSTPPTGVRLFNAATSTGRGPSNVSLTFQIAVPSGAYTGSYSSTWTFSIVSGP